MNPPDRQKPWYQNEPYPSIVGILLEHELLTEGGTDALKLASRIFDEVNRAEPMREAEVNAAAEQIDREQLGTAQSPNVQAAAGFIVRHIRSAR